MLENLNATKHHLLKQNQGLTLKDRAREQDSALLRCTQGKTPQCFLKARKAASKREVLGTKKRNVIFKCTYFSPHFVLILRSAFDTTNGIKELAQYKKHFPFNFPSFLCTGMQLPVMCAHTNTRLALFSHGQTYLQCPYTSPISNIPALTASPPPPLLNISIPQAASSVGKSHLPFQVSGLAALFSSIIPSLPARVRHHHFIRQGMECMVHNLHLHRVMR